MKGLVLVSLSVLLLASHLASSRSIGHDQNPVSDGGGSFLPWRLSETSVTCDATYGFLPCSDNVLGLLFLIVVYEILLSIGAQYVDEGSNLFFQIIGPGVVGGSVFQMLGTIPQLVMVLVPSFTNSEAAAQERATTGMGMVLGGVAMVLTLAWGLTIVFGSYDPSEVPTADVSQSEKPTTTKGSVVITDVQTSWTARLVLVASVPFLILELQNVLTSTSGKRVIILIALIATVLMLCAYIVYQSFEPWIQNRCFEYIIDKRAKDKLLQLITTNGRPDTRKIQRLFNKIAKEDIATVTAAEIRSLILGVKMDDDINADLVLEEITTYFDISGDGGIDKNEFINGITRLASALLDETPTQTTNSGNNNSQVTSQDQQPLLLASNTSTSQTATNSWSTYFRATFFVIFGTFIASALSEPLVKSFIEFSTVTNMSSFTVSYLFLPLSLGYNTILQSITSASQKTQKSTSLTLSSLYSGVFMKNVVGLMPYLAPVYFRNLTTNVSTELHLVVLICVGMGAFTSFNTTFPRWTGYVAICLYPISIAATYVLTSVLV